MKKLSAFVLFLFLLLSLSSSAFAYEYEAGDRTALVNDFADLIEYEDETTLNYKLEQISEAYECEVAVLTVNSTDGQDITAFADDYYDYNGFGFGENDDGIMLVVDMGAREFAMTTHGTAIDIFTDYNLAQLESEFVYYLSDGQYITAFIAFYEKCESIFTDYAYYEENYDGGYVYFPDDDELYYDDIYNDNYHGSSIKDRLSYSFSLKWIIISVVIGIIIAFLYTGYLKSQLKTVRSKASAQDYVVPGSFNVTQQRDIYLYGNVKKTPKPKNNSSSGKSGGSSFGGGSSTHRSSSGRTHGGSRGSF